MNAWAQLQNEPPPGGHRQADRDRKRRFALSNDPKKFRGVLSASSGGAFFVSAGVSWLVLGLPVLALAFVLLAVGTIAFHIWVESTLVDHLDHAGMLSTMAVLIVVPLTWPIHLGAALVGLTAIFSYSHTLIMTLLLAVCVTAVAVGAWMWLIPALVIQGLAYWIWHKRGDAPHAAWHALSAVAMTLIAAGMA